MVQPARRNLQPGQ